ncbi:uncharacterized protein J4E92_006971 [Alternaria infectoria]|uniref:uncharacterized protein n=1 Tax=Alternaria infectoria TaxID=45303 RepID=UPI002220B2F1|nr:uncharacterized protein J4E92_006971 [Alternaria infectoria]KAI4924934.1 hypothetical protein J4E92_006971 [Alternaria infectoria]
MTTTTAASLIASLESHLAPTLVFTSPPTSPSQPSLHLIAQATLTKLRNIGPGRVKDMRTLGHSKQIISHIPIAAAPPICSKINDTMHSAVIMNGEKVAALSMLPSEGKEAAKELARCVGKMKFVGGCIGMSRNIKLEEAEWEDLWDVAERYRVPILLREMWPVGSEIPDYQHSFPSSVYAPLLTHIHSSQTTSPLPLLHLYLSCVFDRHPALRLILAHPGALPSLIPRIEMLLTTIPSADKPKRSFLDVWQHNIYLTTADAQDMSSLRALLERIPVDRVLYASNYPLEERGKELMEELRESGFLTQVEWDRVAWGNAETVFNLKGANMKAGRR